MGRTLLSQLMFIVLFAAVLASPCFAEEYGKVTSRRVAEGVVLFTTSPYGDVGFCGNSIAILSEDGVLVFDTTGTPETAATILGEIRKLTDKPVRFVVNSHWHWDHWSGNEVYKAAFPGVQIITHEKTREQMIEVEPRWNADGLSVQLPAYVESLEKKVASAKTNHAPDAAAMEKLYNADRNFLNQKKSLHKIVPDVTFSDSMTLWMGGREIRILHARAITAGDTYLYLPKEKILITGDILLSPYPYAAGGTFPSDWLKTLEMFATLEPSIIIPGHGDAQDNKKFLQGYLDLFREILKQVQEARSKGMTPEQTADSIGKQAPDLAAMLSITDPEVTNEFKAYFLDIFVGRACKEMAQPLGDLPDGLPH